MVVSSYGFQTCLDRLQFGSITGSAGLFSAFSLAGGEMLPSSTGGEEIPLSSVTDTPLLSPDADFCPKVEEVRLELSQFSTSTTQSSVSVCSTAEWELSWERVGFGRLAAWKGKMPEGCCVPMPRTGQNVELKDASDMKGVIDGNCGITATESLLFILGRGRCCSSWRFDGHGRPLKGVLVGKTEGAGSRSMGGDFWQVVSWWMLGLEFGGLFVWLMNMPKRFTSPFCNICRFGIGICLSVSDVAAMQAENPCSTPIW